MRAMILSDMLMSKKYIVQQAIMAVIVSVIVSMVTENLFITVPMVTVMIPFSLTFTLLAFDERNNWQQFRLALPITRTNVIAGRYASLALIVLMGLCTGMVALAILIIATTFLPNVHPFASLLANFSWQATVLVAVASVSAIVVMLAFVLPFVVRFGMTKAVRSMSIVFVLLFVGVFALGSAAGVGNSLEAFFTWVIAPEGTLVTAGIMLAAAALFYAASGLVSTKLYAKREF